MMRTKPPTDAGGSERPGSLGRNAVWLGSATVATMAASFLYVTLIARYLGPTDFGRYSLIVAVAGWLVSVGQGGGTTALIVISARHPERSRDLIKPGLLIQAAVGLTAVIIGWPVIRYASHDDGLLVPTVLYGAASTALLALSVPVSIHRGLNRMEWAWALAAGQFLTLMFFPIVVWSHGGLSATIGANAVACVVLCAIVIPLSTKALKKATEGNKAVVLRALIASSAGLWLVSALQWMHWKIGLLVVQTLAGSHDVGIYSAGVRVIEGLRTIPWFVLMITLPSIAGAAGSNPQRARLFVQTSLRLLMLVAFPVSIVLILFASQIVGGIYTHEFVSAGGVFRIAALGFIPGCAHWVFLNALVAFRAHAALIKAYSVSIVSQMVVSALLTRQWGAEGAVVGGVLGETLAAVICGIYVAQRIGHPVDAGALRLIIVGVCITAYSLTRTPLSGPSAFWWAALLCSLHLTGAFLVRAVSVSEIRGLVNRSFAQRQKSAAVTPRSPLLPQDT